MCKEKTMVKQIIVIRSDLRNSSGQKVRTGKIAAQVAHASLKVFFDIMKKEQCSLPDYSQYYFQANKDVQEWIDGIFTKICVSVDSEQELIDCYNKAKGANLQCALIEDNGSTEFGGVKTKTCIAIGPAKSEDIDKITGHLKLL